MFQGAGEIIPGGATLFFDIEVITFFGLLSLVSHKKIYLVCVKLTNFRIFTKPIPNFFSKYKTETANRGQRQLLFLT